MKKLLINPDNAALIYEWATTRSAVAQWRSSDMSFPRDPLLTPALTKDGQPAPKPEHWAYVTAPELYRLSEIFVDNREVFKAIPVTLKIKGGGFRSSQILVLTRTSERKVESALAKCKEKHGNGWYQRTGDEFEHEMTVYYSTGEVPLAEYHQKNLVDKKSGSVIIAKCPM